ncbi:RNA-dependent RNA polymerase [Wuchang Cockroach Virus 1]|uniref:RNA-directed RNA polymerase L n=1 Tax=Wuchang Cockroach Virus 1 TaxID=1608097 RepID=A0A0B5KXX2_9VIRU|nr:RNA-dependent RNA polymerase [Wuchang Cockroach Virus 1]AJG39258.1 RNA-dependent RNA polymerase [Wuchang Cockroach Virus 1]
MDPFSLVHKKGKIDRQKENWREKRKNERALLPRDDVERQAFDINEQYNEMIKEWRNPNINPEDALELYLQARAIRHDNWIRVLKLMRVSRGMRFGDIEVGKFCEELGIQNVPIEIARKTPDILSMSPDGTYIVLGDVTVSKSPKIAHSKKVVKYNSIHQFFSNLGYNVKWNNFILEEQLTNVWSELYKMENDGIILVDKEKVNRTIHYHELLQKIMINLPTKTNNAQMFQMLLSRHDGLDVQDVDIKLPASMIGCELENYEIMQTESQLMEELTSKTNELLKDGYFDCNINKVNSKINDIISSKENEEGDYADTKSTLKVVFNTKTIEPNTGYDLIQDYIQDIQLGLDSINKDYLLDLLPSRTQVEKMKDLYKLRTEQLSKDESKKILQSYKDFRVYGPNQYDMTRNSTCILTTHLCTKLKQGKKNRNVKTKPLNLNPAMFNEYKQNIDCMINYLGSESNKPVFLDDSWDSATNTENDHSKDIREIYNIVKKTNGAQLAQGLSNMYQKIMHAKTSISVKDTIYVPPSGAFIMIKPRDHAPITAKNCDIPMLFIAREKHSQDTQTIQSFLEHEVVYKGDEYIYFVSKLSRLNLNKFSNWDQAGYKLVTACTHLINICPNLKGDLSTVVGLLTILLLDSHQKVSEYLDLLKYISFMPFADISRLDKLVEDKLDLLMKTKMDVWLILRIKEFMNELSDINRLNAKKPKLHMFNCQATRESLGLSINLPSFTNPRIRHGTVQEFIEEITMLYIIRPKQLYGSQFMDKSITQTAEWNNEYNEEVAKHGGWATVGNEDSPYPFDAKFTYNRSAIMHAHEYFKKTIPLDDNKIAKELHRTVYDTYMHYNCSLRGCTKYISDRKNNNDLHTTSMEACLAHYRNSCYKEEQCTTIGVVDDFINRGEVMQFSMSEKEQRGGGRPIATPTLGAKAGLMLIEKPEQVIGKFVPNNIIVPGKHKLKEQAETYKDLLSEGAKHGMSKVYQLTEDQTKYSENDNVKKYYCYIANNSVLPINVRIMQTEMLKRLEKREHLVKRMPTRINSEYSLSQHRNKELNGIKAIVGWPQGMLNDLSTSLHSIADYWITYMYNKCYPNNPVIAKGLVHSDDSWVAVACDSENDFKRFAIFRMLAKKYFCLKLNDKKLWGSKHLGELVSNYNINGNVHLSISKMLANSMNNLLYQNWVMDVNNQISSIQQLYRAGARLPTLIMLSTVLRQQLMACYNVSGLQKEYLNILPIELGGYPSSSAFELGVTGLTSHYNRLIEFTKNNPNHPITDIMRKSLLASNVLNAAKKLGKEDPSTYAISKCMEYPTDVSQLVPNAQLQVEIENDYAETPIPSRGEVFSCVKHLMPKSNKLTKTLEQIKDLPFDTDNLEMIVTRPDELTVSLGHLKHQLTTRLYELASEHYTQSARRLAVSQALQASGKVVRFLNLTPMTINELLQAILDLPIRLAKPDLLQIAMTDDTDVSNLCISIVHNSELVACDADKRKIINRMPEIIDKFTTVASLKNVLLYTIDTVRRTDYLNKYGYKIEPLDILRNDSRLIHLRFNIYFRYFQIEQACNMIMRLFMFRERARLWMHPYLKTDTLSNFLEDLYGKSVSDVDNFKVKITNPYIMGNRDDANMVNTMYSVNVLNNIYPGKFDLQEIKTMSPVEALDKIDYENLDNEEFLKYAVLRKLYCNTDWYLNEYDKSKVYDQEFIVKQEYDEKHKKYFGYFELLARYGKTILKVSGEPEDVEIESSTNNINEILHCMFILVNRNFTFYKYQHYTYWSRSMFWKSKPKFSRTFLSNYHTTCTLITQTKSESSVPFLINKNLARPVSYGCLEAIGYELTENLRVVVKITKDSSQRLDNIHQNLQCPYASDCVLIGNLLDGLDNEELLHSGIIISVSNKRYYNCSRTRILGLLESRSPPLSNSILVDMYTNFVNKLADDNQVPTRHIQHINEEVEYFTISGETVAERLIKYEETTPEDLTYVELEYEMDSDERVGCLVKYDNLSRTLCEILYPRLTDYQQDLLIHMLLADRKIVTKVISDLDRDPCDEEESLAQRIETLHDAASCMRHPTFVNYFIYSNQLDVEATWANIDVRKVMYLVPENIDSQLKKVFTLLRNSLIESIFEETEEDVIQMLRDRLFKH